MPLYSSGDTSPSGYSASSTDSDHETKTILPSLNAKLEKIEDNVEELVKNQDNNTGKGSSHQNSLANAQLRSLDTHADAANQAIGFLAKESKSHNSNGQALANSTLGGMPCSNGDCCPGAAGHD